MPSHSLDPEAFASVGDRVTFDYVKGKDFRSLRADGAIGGVTPSGIIHFALYSERPAIPQRVVHEIMPGGTLSDAIETETVTRGSIVREMDVDVFFHLEVAENFHKWLGEQIERVKAIKAFVSDSAGQ